MRRNRTTATFLRRTLFVLLLAGLAATVVVVAPSSAHSDRAGGPVPRLVFPLIAKTVLWDNYGDPRGNGRHAGIDMENPWRAPIVAVESGRIEYASSNLGGCMLYLYGQSGTTYMYIHLNNDRTPRNDNTGGCVEGTTFAAPNGSEVRAGHQVAFNGDSGDANGNPHLHFEVHPNDGADVNPFPHLKRATKALFAAREGSKFSLALRGRVVAAGGGTLRLLATSVRSYPGGRWLLIDPRTVELSVPPESAVEEQLARAVGAQILAATQTQPRVAVFTPKARVTRDALLGVPGALAANRILALP
jgi:hypothetical protein